MFKNAVAEAVKAGGKVECGGEVTLIYSQKFQ
jgi:hypothetical protein